MADHNELGKKGEDAACSYLESIGYIIIQRNYHYNRCEIDIIATFDNLIVFVEVKTRKTLYWGDPEEAVDKSKIKKIVRAADHYLRENEIDLDTRFDIISILINNKDVKINHIEDAFLSLPDYD